MSGASEMMNVRWEVKMPCAQKKSKMGRKHGLADRAFVSAEIGTEQGSTEVIEYGISERRLLRAQMRIYAC